MTKETIEYDPTDIQLDSYGKIGFSDLDIIHFANEHSVKMLLHQYVLTLHELKNTKKNLLKTKDEIDILKTDREDLRVKLAQGGTGEGVEVASLFISYLGGFSINMLTNDWANGLGWVIFLLAISTVYFLRFYNKK